MSTPQRAPVAATALFNDFISRAVRHGNLRVEHRRVRTRQPESEAFVRRALAVIAKLAPATEVDIRVVELTAGHSIRGRTALAEAASEFLAAVPVLRPLLGEPGQGLLATADLPPLAEFFAVLNAYSFREITGAGGAQAFATSAATVAAAISGNAESMKKRVQDAADSVFAQSFSDVHAISLCAAFCGKRVALNMLGEVSRRRLAGGDFEAFSLAPLSHDTSAALELLRAQLMLDRDFAGMSREVLYAQSLWLAAEGLGAWMERHGVDHGTAAAISHALETAGHIVSASAAKLPAQGAKH